MYNNFAKSILLDNAQSNGPKEEQKVQNGNTKERKKKVTKASEGKVVRLSYEINNSACRY